MTLPQRRHDPQRNLPDFLRPREPLPKLVPPPESIALQVQQYANIFPRVLERICGGDTLATALRELPIEFDSGAFFRWVRKDRERHDLYKEAKEVCAEVWSGRLVNLAEGLNSEGNETLEDVNRSRFKFDVYKWLMERYNRKDFGDVKTIDLNTTISVKSALEDARARAATIIDVEAEEWTDMEQFALPEPSTNSDEANQDDQDESETDDE